MRAFGETANSVGETDAFVFHHKREYVASFVATEAVKSLFMWSDEETGRFLFVKRAKRGEVRAVPFQWNVTADDIDDVAGGSDLFEGGGRKKDRP